jgi:hypothetical protein
MAGTVSRTQPEGDHRFPAADQSAGWIDDPTILEPTARPKEGGCLSMSSHQVDRADGCWLRHFSLDIAGDTENVYLVSVYVTHAQFSLPKSRRRWQPRKRCRVAFLWT